VRLLLENNINDILRSLYPTKIKGKLPLRVFISSFRPYAVDGDKHTRGCTKCAKKPCTDYMIFHNHIPASFHKRLDAPVLQFYNPWVASAVVSFEVVDCMDAILKNKILLGDATVLSKMVTDPQKSTDQQRLLKCIGFSKELHCLGGLNSLASEKLADYKAKLETTRKMIDDAMNDL
jgi:hypothetical protein